MVCPFCGTTVVKPAPPPPAATTRFEDDARRNQLLGAMMLLQRRLAAEGVPAPAKIISMQPLNMAVGNGTSAPAQLFAVVVEVLPEAGPAYTAQTNIAVSQASLGKYQPGAPVNVRYDPRDPTVLVFEARR
jgi:hypothetical protein